MTGAASTLPLPGSPGAWVLAARPATLPVAVAPVLVGAALAASAGAVRWSAVAAALGGALCLQIGANLANDVFDAQHGADDERRIGPPRAVQKGLLTPAAVKRGMALVFALAVVIGATLVWRGGLPVALLGVASVVSGVAYTGGPFPLGYRGLGDLFVFLFFGPGAVVGTVFVAAGHVPPGAWPAAVGVGALATNVLVVNNVRDAEGDARSDKRTLVVRFGRRFGVLEYAALLAVALGAPLCGVLTGALPLPALGALLAAPLGLALTRRLAAHRDGPTLNGLLARSAQLMLAYSVLLGAGIALGGG